jgi:predicted PurR-regulated permease PerM
MAEERVVLFRPRTILVVLGIAICVAIALQVLWLARGVLVWVLIALFLSLALNPAVDWMQEKGVRRRGVAVGIVFLLVLAGIVALGATFVPILVNQVNDFVTALPGYVEDVTEGRGRLGDLAERYDLVQRVQDAVHEGGASRVLGLSGTALAITKGIITAIVATVTIAFMTFFMLLEGPAWVERMYSLIPERQQPRWRAVGERVYRTVGGYVTGNLFISLIAGVTSTIVLTIMDVPFAIALGLVVALLDLIPLAGATLAAIIVSTVAFIQSVPAGLVVLVFFIVYQQLENHLLQPLVYGRTVQLSPLAVLLAVLIGAEIAGVLGALGAIPIAGAIQVVLIDWLQHRRGRIAVPTAPEPRTDGG